MAVAAPADYTGHCDHHIIHAILKDHREVLLTIEENGLGRLRTQIHDIVKDMTDLEVFIYIHGRDTPIVVQKGEPDSNYLNKLVITFEDDGRIDYRWVQRTFANIAREKLADLAARVANTAFELLLTTAQAFIQQSIKWDN